MASQDIKSSYRLFLRATSAAVMHHSKATRNLRLLWRPIFDAAATNAKRLGDPRYAPEHQKLRSWLREWERRVDGTLSLLANAAVSRGLPHTVVRNLALMTGTHIQRTYTAGFGSRSTWRPSLPASAPEYKVAEPRSREYTRVMQMKEQRAISEQALDAFSEVVRMAESRHHLTLGRVLPR